MLSLHIKHNSLYCSVLLQTTNDIMHFIWALSPDSVASVFRLFKRQETRLNGQIPERKSSSWWDGRRKRGEKKPQWVSPSNENRMNHCQLIIYMRFRAVYWMWKPQKIAYIQIVTTFSPLFLNQCMCCRCAVVSFVTLCNCHSHSHNK